MGSCQSGQLGLTVNQVRELRWFESATAHSNCVCQRCLNTRVRAHIAQSVEHFLGKKEVIGSSPIVGSIPTLGIVASGVAAPEMME